jgi:hypothetical protein
MSYLVASISWLKFAHQSRIGEPCINRVVRTKRLLNSLRLGEAIGYWLGLTHSA